MKIIPLLLSLLGSLCLYAQIPMSEEHQQLVNKLQESIVLVEPSKYEPIEEWQQWTTAENYQFGKDRGSLPMIADLRSLHPYFRDRVGELIRICKTKGIELAIVEAYRTPAKQNEYRSMGTNYTRSSGGYSKHQYGLAIDVVPIVEGKAEWHNAALWKKVGVVGEKLGLRWGGRWRRLYDPGHFEWTGGVRTTDLALGIYPHVSSEHYPCIDEDIKNLSSFWKAWEAQQSTIATERKESSTSMK